MKISGAWGNVVEVAEEQYTFLVINQSGMKQNEPSSSSPAPSFIYTHTAHPGPPQGTLGTSPQPFLCHRCHHTLLDPRLILAAPNWPAASHLQHPSYFLGPSHTRAAEGQSCILKRRADRQESGTGWRTRCHDAWERGRVLGSLHMGLLICDHRQSRDILSLAGRPSLRISSGGS